MDAETLREALAKVCGDPGKFMPPPYRLVADAVEAHLATLERGDREWMCEYGSVLVAPPDEDGDCKGCSGRQAIRGCGWVLVVPDES